VYLTGAQAGDTFAGITFEFQSITRPVNAGGPILAPANLSVGNYTTNILNWTGAGQPGPIGTAQFNVAGTGVLEGPGDFVLGTFDVTILGPLDGTTKDIYAALPQNASGLINGGGSRITWNAASAGSQPGYVAFAPGAFGNPGWGTSLTMHQPASVAANVNSLQITKVPEPTSLALIALGGFALLRRRN